VAFEDITRHVQNEASVVGQVLAEAPKAVWDEITNDCKNDRAGLELRAGISFVIGLGSGIALARSPVLGKCVFGTVGVYQSLRMASSVASVMGRAWDADSDQQRQSLVAEARASLAREGATALETLPTFAAGGAAGGFAARRVGVLDRFAYRVAEKVELPMRDTLMFVGPGTERLPKTLMGSDSQLDVLTLSEMLSQRHPWMGIEEARALRLSDLKLGRTIRGTDSSLDVLPDERPGRILFHTHPERGLSRSGYSVPGARPSLRDIANTGEFGIIQSGQLTTVYQGGRADFLANHADPTAFSPNLRAVVLDRENQLAVHLDTSWDWKKGDFIPHTARPLDYAETLRTLSSWDRSWASISAISSDFNAITKPGMLDLLKLGAYDSARAPIAPVPRFELMPQRAAN